MEGWGVANRGHPHLTNHTGLEIPTLYTFLSALRMACDGYIEELYFQMLGKFPMEVV